MAPGAVSALPCCSWLGSLCWIRCRAKEVRPLSGTIPLCLTVPLQPIARFPGKPSHVVQPDIARNSIKTCNAPLQCSTGSFHLLVQ